MLDTVFIATTLFWTVVRGVPLDLRASVLETTTIDVVPQIADSLNVSYFFGSSETSEGGLLQTQLAPTRVRGTRSASSYNHGGFGGLGGLALLPLLQSLLQPPADPAKQTDDTATTTASPLAALLPLLLLTGGGGGSSAGSVGSYGSFGSFESGEGGGNLGLGGLNALLDALALTVTTTAAPAAANLIANPDAKKSELHLKEGSNKARVGDWKVAHEDDPAAVNNNECLPVRNRSTLCDNLPVDKILALKNAVIVTKGRSIYRVKPNGEPIDMKPTIFDVKIDPISATAHIKNFYFVFQGDKYTKFDASLKQAPGKFPRLVSSGFPGVITPVDGVFQLNNHTFVFMSGSKFVYFQPDANPNVDPKYSPQFLDDVPGAPGSVDSAFTIKGRKFLYKSDIIYEMTPDEMKVLRDLPAVSTTEKTWLKCPDIYPANCGPEQQRQRSFTTTTSSTTEIPLP